MLTRYVTPDSVTLNAADPFVRSALFLHKTHLLYRAQSPVEIKTKTVPLKEKEKKKKKKKEVSILTAEMQMQVLPCSSRRVSCPPSNGLNLNIVPLKSLPTNDNLAIYVL